jgi:ATP-dependent helicase/DNAse subunit B
VTGVALGALNRDKASLFGYVSHSGDEDALRTVTPQDMDDMKEGWNESLREISGKILVGSVDIDPVDQNKACNTCELKAVCRNGLKSSIAA